MPTHLEIENMALTQCAIVALAAQIMPIPIVEVAGNATSTCP
jgi:hypothetical protein